MKNLKFKAKKCDSLNPYIKEGDILTFPEGESHYLNLTSPRTGNVKIQAKYVELINDETTKEPEKDAQPPKEPNQTPPSGTPENSGDDAGTTENSGAETNSEAPGGAVPTGKPSADVNPAPVNF